MMRKFLPVLLAFLSACLATTPKNSPKPAAPILRVRITQAGAIFLNGRAVSLDELDQPFAGAASAQGKVFYYRQNPEGEPPPIWRAVMNKIIDHRLPVRLCKDFQDDDCKHGVP
jgi:predicted secreted protein